MDMRRGLSPWWVCSLSSRQSILATTLTTKKYNTLENEICEVILVREMLLLPTKMVRALTLCPCPNWKIILTPLAIQEVCVQCTYVAPPSHHRCSYSTCYIVSVLHSSSSWLFLWEPLSTPATCLRFRSEFVHACPTQLPGHPGQWISGPTGNNRPHRRIASIVPISQGSRP